MGAATLGLVTVSLTTFVIIGLIATLGISTIDAEYRIFNCYAECRYAECSYAEYRYAKCRGQIIIPFNQIKIL